MLELLFLLLPIAACYGWYMGYRSAKKGQSEISDKLSRDYVTGVNYLLSNQQEKAVNLFLDILQKDDDDNISNDAQFEAELTLGNLFLSRGEVDSALRIHKKLSEDETYSVEQRLLAIQQLAIDFMSVGIFDRAESLYLSLVDEPYYTQNALNQLAKIYQKTRDWGKAVNVTEKAQMLFPIKDNRVLANYYCEFAQIKLKENNLKEATSLLMQALHISISSVRATKNLGDLAFKEGNYKKAISYYQDILNKNTVFIGEVIPSIEAAYMMLERPDDYEIFLIAASGKHNDANVELALARCIEKKDSPSAAQSHLYMKLNKVQSMYLFHQIIKYQIDEAEYGRAKDSLIKLHQIVGEKINITATYRCVKCGYGSYKLSWCCPSCNNWETFKPNVLGN